MILMIMLVSLVFYLSNWDICDGIVMDVGIVYDMYSKYYDFMYSTSKNLYYNMHTCVCQKC